MCVFHLVSLQLFSHFIHVPIILRNQRSHYTVTGMNNVTLNKEIFALQSTRIKRRLFFPMTQTCNKNKLAVM